MNRRCFRPDTLAGDTGAFAIVNIGLRDLDGVPGLRVLDGVEGRMNKLFVWSTPLGLTGAFGACALGT